MSDENNRETGARATQPKRTKDIRGGVSQKAASSPATEKTSGAGPAIAERSKDAKTTKPGRQAGAYVKR